MDERKQRISCEFFPPKTEAGKTSLLTDVTPALQDTLSPEFFSVTYGAGGSTRDTTLGVVSAIRETGINVAPHLSFGGDDENTVGELLDIYKEKGVKRIVALRGDIPSGTGGKSRSVYASELVEFIRKHSGEHFHLEVAAYPEIHPEAKSYDSDLQFLKNKFDAGANSAITQFFYNVESYFYFLDQCASVGIEKPIYAGIMPLHNFANIRRFAGNTGAEIPRWICQKMDSFRDDEESQRQFGFDVVLQLCQTILESDAPGIHFYTMNQVEPTRELFTHLGL
ncbi:MAG: methylenetetrahydrofolate reductase [NAD(P)H] [Halioglobus sp.]|nr:methylenetetrahydrofolate reductase [NAD(P)H] [Halioglobus sp.]